MKRLWIILFILFTSLLFAEEKTFLREYTYSALKQDTKETARRVALYEVKMLLLEEVGVYIQSELNIKDWEQKIGEKLTSGEFAEHKLTSITAGVTKTEIIDEKWTKKWNKQEFYLRAKITLDPDDINNKISKIVENREKLQELEEVKKKANDAYAEIERLRIELAQVKSEAEQVKLNISYVEKTSILKATELYRQGVYLVQMSMNNYDKAKDIFYEVIKIDPSFVPAYYWLGVIYSSKGNTEKAIQFYEKVLELDPENRSENRVWALYYNLGLAYDKNGNSDKAIQSYKKSIEIYPKYADAHYNIGLIYKNKEKDYDKAIISFNKVVEIDSFRIGVFYNLGDSYYFQKNFKKAIQYFEKHIQFDIHDAYGLLTGNYSKLGRSYLYMGNHNKAILATRKAIELTPNNPTNLHTLGVIYVELSDTTKAIQIFEKNIELNPNYPRSYNDLGVIYNARGNLDKALPYYYKAANLGLKSIQDWLGKNVYEPAKKALDINPENISALITLSDFYYNIREINNNNLELSLKYRRKAARLGDESSQDWLEKNINNNSYNDKKISRKNIEKLADKAQKEFSNEEYDKSINTTTEVIEKVLSVSLNNSEEFEKYRDEIIGAYFIRGQSYMLKRNYFESIPNFTNIINLDPSPIYHVLSLNRRFISNLVLGTRIKTLCEDLSMIDKLFSQHANTIDNERDQIINHKNMSDIEDNCDMWNDFADLDINDEDMEYLNTLAVILFQEAENPLAAISVAKEVAFRDPSRDNTYNNLGLFYYNSGRKEESVQYLKKALDINPENISALITLSDFYYNINNLELSLKYGRKAAQLGDKSMQRWFKDNGYKY